MRTLLSKGVSPAEVVLVENLHRRHLTASQRAQMVVETHEWRPAGQHVTTPIGEVKIREEMASEANVSPAKFVLVEKLHRRYLMATQGGQPSVEAYQWATGGGIGLDLLRR